MLRPLVDYVENLRRDAPGELVTVVVPEIVPRHWWEHFLHNKTALFIRTAFLFRPNVVVTAVPFHLGNAVRLRDRFDYDEQLDESLDEDIRHDSRDAVDGREECGRGGEAGSALISDARLHATARYGTRARPESRWS